MSSIISTVFDIVNQAWDFAHALLVWLITFLWPPTVILEGGRSVHIKKLISEGGFGYVYLAQDSRSGDSFALKKMLCQSDEQLEGAKREILYHREFRHPNLLPLIGSAVLQNTSSNSNYTPGIVAYLLFPYISGGSLRDEINKRILSSDKGAAWPEIHILRIFRGILKGVRELHQHKPPLAHRDLKPENVLLKANGTPVIIDFGSMTAADLRITNRSEALMVQDDAAQNSTMPYRAPGLDGTKQMLPKTQSCPTGHKLSNDAGDSLSCTNSDLPCLPIDVCQLLPKTDTELFDVAKDAVIDSRVDVWSLGCLLFAMAFGYSPFEYEFSESNGKPRVVECTFLRVIGKIPFPNKHRYSKELIDCITWILQQDASGRPYVADVLRRVEEMISTISSSSSASGNSRPPSTGSSSSGGGGGSGRHRASTGGSMENV